MPKEQPFFNPGGEKCGLGPILEKAPCNALGPGKPQAEMRALLAALTPEELVASQGLRDRAMAQACLAGLWLRHDFLDESHRISQEIKTPAGSYWHAIMHRREPDFANSKYWFQRVGRHPVFEPLVAAARQAATQTPQLDHRAQYLLEQTEWDPFRFVDLCESALVVSAELDPLCRSIQQYEWEWLFDACYRRAIAK